MADRLIDSGIKVTAVGRRQDRINDFIKQHGESKASGIPFDITQYQKAPEFASEVMKKFPDVDCLFLNAGIQAKYDLTNFENVDLEKFNSEMTVNYTSLVAFAHAFLPFLKKQKQASIIFTGAHIGLVPASTLPNYCASKAALNVFTICLRDQLNAAGSNVKVIEIYPPLVQSELHDYMGPEVGRNLGMPSSVFTAQAMEGLNAGHDQIIIGAPGGEANAKIFNEIVDHRRTMFESVSEMMRGMGP